MTPHDIPPRGPLTDFLAEFDRPIMRVLLWALWIEVGVVAVALAPFKFPRHPRHLLPAPVPPPPRSSPRGLMQRPSSPARPSRRLGGGSNCYDYL